MRETIFRGKRIDNGEWIEGSHVFCRCRHYILEYDNSGGFDERWQEWVEIFPDSLGQFTGLIDRNKNRIFEGDILKHNPDDDDDWNDYVVWWNKESRFELASFVNYPIKEVAKKYDEESRRGKLLGRIYGDSIARAEIGRNCTMLRLFEWVYGSCNPSLIIGNITDNPELLVIDNE